MRRFPLAAFLALGVFLTTLPATASRSASEASMTIRLISSPGRTTLRDLAPKGAPNKGDSISGTSILRNEVAQFGKPKGARVGTDSFVFTLTSASRGQIKVTTKLPGGTLRSQGRSLVAGTPSIPVVGGTGDFAGARGTVVVRDRQDGTSRNVYRLRLP